MGRNPSITTVTHDPTAASTFWLKNSSEWFSTSLIPASCISNMPASEIGPKRFLVVFKTLNKCCESPSKYKTVSTMCSKTLGPATVPSLVTCPTSITGIPVFLAVSEAGIFEMQEAGMREVENPSELFLSQKVEAAVGSCVTVVMEGFRPILFEIQALTLITKFGNPRRTASGFSVNRLQVLLEIIEKSLNLNLSSYDVYLNVAGGLKVNEYAADLAVCLAVISSVKNKPLPSNRSEEHTS